MTEQIERQDQELRKAAVRRLKRRRDYYGHLIVYILMNGLMVGIWALTGMPGFFWPGIIMGVWGVGLVMDTWNTFGRQEINEQSIRREMDRLQHGH